MCGVGGRLPLWDNHAEVTASAIVPAGRDSEERRYCPLRDVIAKSGAIVPCGTR
ncbi:hypothetical protein L3i20_v201690 [Paenibacillus sp. L3-i20]|nr:hypothetical protein L3i20_v201690 [Paenibacillus sp. L3-i20]